MSKKFSDLYKKIDGDGNKYQTEEGFIIEKATKESCEAEYAVPDTDGNLGGKKRKPKNSKAQQSRLQKIEEDPFDSFGIYEYPKYKVR